MEKHKKYVVRVTQEDINTAIPRDSGHCMIADAVRECLPNAIRVMVDLQCTRWTDPEKGVRYIALTPAKAQQALVNFDQGIPIQPFTITLYPFQTVRAGDGKPRKRAGRPPRLQEKDAPEPERVRGADEAREVTPGVVHKNGHGGEAVRPPHIEGGRTPPQAALASYRGKRRQFGIRMLDQ